MYIYAFGDNQYPYRILRGLVRECIYEGTSQCIRFTCFPIRRDAVISLCGDRDRKFRTNRSSVARERERKENGASLPNFIHYPRITTRSNKKDVSSGCVKIAKGSSKSVTSRICITDVDGRLLCPRSTTIRLDQGSQFRVDHTVRFVGKFYSSLV